MVAAGRQGRQSHGLLLAMAAAVERQQVVVASHGWPPRRGPRSSVDGRARRPPRRSALRRTGSPSRSRRTSATRQAGAAGRARRSCRRRPSRSCPPTAEATTGTPQAIASSGTIPNGSYHGTRRTASAERSRAGSSSRPTRPRKRTPVLDAEPCGPARAAARPRGRCRASAASGPPATSSSVSGPPRRRAPATDRVADALALHEAADVHERAAAGRGVRSAASPSGRKCRGRRRTARP